MKKSIQFLLVVISGILVGVMVFSAYKLISDNLEHKDAREKDIQTANTYAIREQVSPTPRVYAEETQAELVLDDEISPLNSKYDLEKFYSDHPDAVAWLYCPDTPIDYGVVEAEDNAYYLNHSIEGDYSLSGALFVDCKCERDFSCENTVIYGHHMNDGTKLAKLLQYKNADYYEKHPVMYLSTPDMNYRVEIFAAYLTDADSDTYTFSFSSEEAYAEYLQRMVSQSDIQTNVQLSSKDRIVTLSTCSYEFYDARYVVQGKLVPIH